MFGSSFCQRTFVVALLTALLAGGDALAQRGERGSRGGDGGGGRSYSRGGGGGGGGGGESRSFSRSGGGESRSFSRSGGGESRSFSRGDFGGSSRSPRSFSGDSGSSSRSFRSESTPSRQFRPSDSGSSRSFNRGSTEFRSSSRPDAGRPAFSPSTREAFRTDQSIRGTVERGDRPSSVERSFRSGGQSDQGRQQYQARRVSEEQVREFLQMRGDSRQRQADATDVLRDGRSFRGDRDDRDQTGVARRIDADRDQPDRNLGDSNRGDRDFNRDFNRDRDSDRSRDFVNRGDRDGDRDYQRWREGAWGRDRDDDNRDWSGRWRDGDRFDSARSIRNDWRRRDFDRYPFHGNWWGGNHWHGSRWNWWGPYAFRHHRPWFWWSWTTAPLLTTWLPFGWSRPYYWDYGPGEYIYCTDGVVYVNGRWHQPAPVFYERTVQIVERAPELTPDEAAQLEWLPLGVFAVTPDGAAQADLLVQLAVTKDGVIGGTANDQRGGKAYAIEGMVDRQTQRAVWSYTNDRDQRIVMETSIYNLTQPEATGLVHYGPNDFKVVQLVRLEDPAKTPTSSGAVGELPTPSR